MPKEVQKTFEQNMEAMSKMSPAEVQAKDKLLNILEGCKIAGTIGMDRQYVQGI